MVLQDISFITDFTEKSSLVVGVYSDGELSKSAKVLDNKLNGEIAKNILKIGFKGKIFESVSFVSAGDFCKEIVLIGLGEVDKKFTNYELEKLGAAIYSKAKTLDSCVVEINSSDLKSDLESSQSIIAFGSLLKSWNFDKYKTKKDEKTKLSDIQFLATNAEASEKDFKKFRNLAEAIFLTRAVVSEPANVIYPESLAEIAQKELSPLGVEIEILSKEDMAAFEMNALLGVAQGSAHEPKMLVLRWNGSSDKSEKPIAFVGKGVTFDSGGLSLKPGDGMHEMRHDMAGSGVVLGLLKAVALNKLPVNVVGIMALVENMPSGTAQRPGDIVKSMSGQTIEVLNTDAEGRLILADALWYTQKRFSPEAMIDLATLTGAIVVALGHEFAGLFSNDDELAAQIAKSSEFTGEKVWRMPMTEHFDKKIDSEIADMQNISKTGTGAGGTTAAHFLNRFVNNVKWAHIDIAGVMITSDDLFVCSKGVTGFGVHLLYDFLCRNKNLFS